MQTEKVTQNIKTMSNEVVTDIWTPIKDFLNIGFHIGEGDKQINLTIGLLLLFIISFIITSFILKVIRKVITRKMEENDKRKFISIFSFIKYIIYVVVSFILLSISGINITPFLAASAALLVGVGLALQQLFQDVLGGVFIILDKSLLVGDVVEVEGKVGKITEIKLRTTRALTRDDKIIIIPNHKFISDTIYNFTQNRKITRESVVVGVAYGSDTALVKELLLKSVEKKSKILKSPKPSVFFEDFADSALVFILNFYISESFDAPGIKSDVRFEIDKLFREHNISIPFPQRDVHIYQTNK
jgi:small-conductance mechanosensitive channel